MAKVYAEQVKKAQTLAAGLKNNYDLVKLRCDITMEQIQQLEEMADEAARMNAEVEALIERQVEALQKAYESTSLLMQHGNTTYLDVLTARQAFLGAQLQQSANRFMQIQSIINLYQALGGGQD